jgi:hypothetical protein
VRVRRAFDPFMGRLKILIFIVQLTPTGKLDGNAYNCVQALARAGGAERPARKEVWTDRASCRKIKDSHPSARALSTTYRQRGDIMRAIRLHMRSLRLVHAIFLLLVILGLGACAGPYGRLRSDAQVTQMFESNAVPTNYNYFYDGRSNMPYAIIGLKPEYTLVSRLWEPCAPNTPDFAYAVRFVYYYPTGEASYPAYGSLILDDEGRTVGIWYSRYRSTGVVVTPGKKVTIYSPYSLDSANWGPS